MYFYIQELETKRKVKGSPKEIILSTQFIDGISVNTYNFSEERFDRTIKRAYRITLHESFRKNGMVSKKQYVVATLNYYDIAESHEDGLFDFENTLYYKLLDKLERIVQTFDISEEEKEELKEKLFDLFALKIDPFFHEIIEEFMKTEEGPVFISHKRLLQEYRDNKRKFIAEYDVCGQEYDICYDIYGNVTNQAYLNKIEQRKCSYQKKENNNYNHSYSNTHYTDEQKKMLKQFYRILGKSVHPDANPGIDTSEQMKFLNKLKKDWEL